MKCVMRRVRKKKKKKKAQTEGGRNEATERRNSEGERNGERERERRVADSSRGTLGWRFSSREMSNGL